jgi:hypothetical protein
VTTGKQPDRDEAILHALRDAARAENEAEEAAWSQLARAAPQLAQPPDEAFRQRLTEAILAQPAAGAGAQGTEAGQVPGREAQRPPAPDSGVTPIGRRPRRPTRRLFVAVAFGAPLAAAASALLLMGPRGEPTELPGYELEASGGLRALRGPADTRAVEPQKLAPSSVLRVVLRPAIAVDGPVQVAVFVAQRGQMNDVEVVSPPVEIAPTGAIAVHAEAGPTFGARRGPWELRLVVSRPELASRSAELGRGPESSGDGWQRLTVPIELVGE